MKVKWLIEELQKCDPDMMVLLLFLAPVLMGTKVRLFIMQILAFLMEWSFGVRKTVLQQVMFV